MGRCLMLAVCCVIALSTNACTPASKDSAPDYSRHSEAEVRRNALPVEPRHTLAVNLFAEYGWAVVGVISEGQQPMPEDFYIRPGTFRWRDVVEYSNDVGLDLSSHAGRTLRSVWFLVEDTQGRLSQYQGDRSYFRGIVLLDEEVLVGAWVSPASKDGQPTSGCCGHSLTGRTLEELTGLSFQEYLRKYRAP